MSTYLAVVNFSISCMWYVDIIGSGETFSLVYVDIIGSGEFFSLIYVDITDIVKVYEL